MDRILFFIPPHLRYEDFMRPKQDVRTVAKAGGNFGNVSTDMPLGPMSLSAYLKAHVPVDFKVIDFNVLLAKCSEFPYSSFAEYFENILSQPEWIAYDPTIIGVSALFNPSYRNILDLGNIGKKLFPKALMIGGGGVPTNMHQEIFKDCKSYDALCYGEGEKPLLNLIKAQDRKKFLEESFSWITAEKSKAGGPFVHEFITNLDEIPFYDYELLNVENYKLNPAMVAYATVGKEQRNFHVMTSRGCIYKCTFCSSHTVHGRDMRYYSLDRVKEDFTRLVKEYGATTFVFQDDHLMGDKKRAMQIFGVTEELGLKGVFQNGLAIYALDRPMLESIKPLADHLVLPVESGSQRVLTKIMKKPLKLADGISAVNNCRQLGIYVTCNIMIGMPGETKADIEESRAFLKTVNANWFIILIATPLVGTEMFDTCVENDYIKGDIFNSEFKKANVETPDFTTDYIQETMYDLNLDVNFVCNPDMRLGDYKNALKGFLTAIRSKSDHAFGHYYASICYDRLGEPDKAEYHMEQAKIAARDPFWQKWLAKFPQVKIEVEMPEKILQVA